MSVPAKNLQYYLDHTDEMPTDPAEIEKLANEHLAQANEAGTEELTVDRFVPPDEKDDKTRASSDAKVEVKDDKAGEQADAEAKAVADALAADTAKKADEKAAADAADLAKAEADKTAKPEGILAKDGKNVIPYSQLETARARATAAEALAKEQAVEIERLKAEKETPKEDVATLTKEELDTLEAESPTLAKTLRAQQASIQKLTEQLQAVAARQEDQAVVQETEVKSEIQAAIDANPTLAGWQTAEDQTLWNEASRFDKVLRESPAYANKSFADRFTKVVELTQSALGIETPKAEVKDELPKLTPEQIKAAAQAKLKGKTSVPVSSSQIPGGAPPAVDERERVEQMSVQELGNKFMNMTPEQMEAYLTTL